jgi:hypothetical protein
MLRHGADDFTSPSKEVVLRIFIALKDPSLSAGVVPQNLGSNDKHDNYFTTDNNARRAFLALGSKGKSILGPREIFDFPGADAWSLALCSQHILGYMRKGY